MSTDPTDPPVSEPPEPAQVTSEETLHFDFPGSDIILRSCDSHNFHVPKLYIANSSPILRELIQTVSRTSDFANGEDLGALPVVRLSESGATLHSLLTLIFPVVPILPPTAEKITELLAAAQKYQMDSVISHIRSLIGPWKDPTFIHPETAFHVYFLAQKQGLLQEAVQAARVTLRLPPMVLEDLGDKLEVEVFDMTGAYLYELWKYHKRIRSDLKSGILEFQNSGLPDNVKALRCEVPFYYIGTSFPLWLDNYINSIAEAPHLFNLIDFENAWASHIKDMHTSYSRLCSCVELSSQLRHAFWEALTAFVDGVIEMVRRASDEDSLQ